MAYRRPLIDSRPIIRYIRSLVLRVLDANCIRGEGGGDWINGTSSRLHGGVVVWRITRLRASSMKISPFFLGWLLLQSWPWQTGSQITVSIWLFLFRLFLSCISYPLAFDYFPSSSFFSASSITFWCMPSFFISSPGMMFQNDPVSPFRLARHWPLFYTCQPLLFCPALPLLPSPAVPIWYALSCYYIDSCRCFSISTLYSSSTPMFSSPSFMLFLLPSSYLRSIEARMSS